MIVRFFRSLWRQDRQVPPKGLVTIMYMVGDVLAVKRRVSLYSPYTPANSI